MLEQRMLEQQNAAACAPNHNPSASSNSASASAPATRAHGLESSFDTSSLDSWPGVFVCPLPLHACLCVPGRQAVR